MAIAPSDRQYEPAGRPTELTDISYLLLQGSHDADVSSCLGLRQFQRVSFSGPGPWFKSLLYVGRANHGQFNTVWGRTDLPAPVSHLLNLRPLLDGEDQRQIAKTFIPAFLDLTLRRNETYRPMFRDYRQAAAWLPDTTYISQYRDPGFRTIADFEEDIDLTSTSLAGGTIEARGLTTWRQEDLKLRGGGTQRNQVTRLGWGEEQEEGELGESAESDPNTSATQAEPPEFEIKLPDTGTALDISAAAALVFDLLDASEEPNADVPLDLTVELVDGAGTSVALPLSHFQPVPGPIETEFTKWPALERLAPQYDSPVDFILQTFALPLEQFTAVNELFDPSRLSTIRLRFDRQPGGAIVLDGIGIDVCKRFAN